MEKDYLFNIMLDDYITLCYNKDTDKIIYMISTLAEPNIVLRGFDFKTLSGDENMTTGSNEIYRFDYDNVEMMTSEELLTELINAHAMGKSETGKSKELKNEALRRMTSTNREIELEMMLSLKQSERRRSVLQEQHDNFKMDYERTNRSESLTIVEDLKREIREINNDIQDRVFQLEKIRNGGT